MNLDQEKPSPLPEIPLPNIRNDQAYRGWLDKWVTEPMKSLRRVVHGGVELTFEQQIAATKKQYLTYRDSLIEQNVPEEEVKQTLRRYVLNLYTGE